MPVFKDKYTPICTMNNAYAYLLAKVDFVTIVAHFERLKTLKGYRLEIL